MPAAKNPADDVKAIRYPATDERFQACVHRVHDVMHPYKGDLRELESALGFMFIGYYYGWKVLHILHGKKTVRKFESILNISIKEEFDPIGPYADKSVGWQFIQKVSNFWKVINGEVEPPGDPEKRSLAS